MTAPVRVLIVDDHPTVIDSIGRRLTAEPDMTVAGTARSGPEAATAIEAADADVVLCDVQMGGDAEGLRLLERYGRRDRPAFLMLSAFDYPTMIRAAFDRGARGYVLKTAELDAVVDAVRAVAGGGTAFSASSLRLIRAALRRPSDREVEVLELIVAGAGNEEIAARLFLSLKTVESHIRRLFNRYGLMNRTELAVLALREGWVDAGAGREA
jgi:DNA-binding NarL/FixJ family response regulator